MTQSKGTDFVFSHQDQCDQRPATVNNHVTEGIPRQDFQSQETSPELPKRRVRHQGISQGWAKAAGLLLTRGGRSLPPATPLGRWHLSPELPSVGGGLVGVIVVPC